MGIFGGARYSVSDDGCWTGGSARGSLSSRRRLARSTWKASPGGYMNTAHQTICETTARPADTPASIPTQTCAILTTVQYSIPTIKAQRCPIHRIALLFDLVGS